MPDFAAGWGLAPCGIEDFGTDYLDAARRAGSDAFGTFGLRIMWREVTDVTARLATLFPGVSAGVGSFEAAFGPLRVVHLTRTDKATQAVSRVRAERSGLWHLNADGTERERLPSAGPLAYDPQALRYFADRAAAQDAAWRAWFDAQKIEPLTVTYKDLAASPVREAGRILAHIGADPDNASSVHPATASLADTLSADWLARYKAEARS